MIEFSEKQRNSENWLAKVISWFILTIILIIAVSFYYDRNDVIPKIIVIIILIFFMVYLNTMNFEYKIDEHFISYKYYPFHKDWNRIERNEVLEITIIKYKPLKEFGGWGIRSNGRINAYTMWGNSGILITLKNGSKILFGTQKYTNHNQ